MDDPVAPAETPMQRALRLKAEMIKARTDSLGSAKLKRPTAGTAPAGASKPWLKK